MAHPADITGRKWNYLTAVEMLGPGVNSKVWLFRCVCGNAVEAEWVNVKKGRRVSCGCMTPRRRTSHGSELLREVIIAYYRTNTDATQVAIAQHCNCTVETVRKALRTIGVKPKEQKSRAITPYDKRIRHLFTVPHLTPSQEQELAEHIVRATREIRERWKQEPSDAEEQDRVA